MIRNSLVFFLFLLLVSCSESFHSEEEMMDYIADGSNGYRYSKTVNGVEYTLQYKPTDLLAKQEIGNTNDANAINKARDKYKGQIYFNLSMAANGKELLSNVVNDKNQFARMVDELAFGMKEKVHLFTSGKDTLQMLDFVYPRMYGMSKSTTILIVYPRDENFLNKPYLNFAIEDLGFFTGEVKFKIETDALRNEPHLTFN